jgi:vitamin B12 transporter
MTSTFRPGIALAAAAMIQTVPFSSAFAQSPIDLIVVTAARGEQKVADTILHTTVITEADIRDSQAADVPTLLRREAGFEFVQNGGIGSVSSTFLRGTNSTQTLVLIDGVRVGSATTGTTALDQIMLDEVERIEIVRGNVSSVYGSEAIGGVIQIFTKKGRGAPAASGSAGFGDRNTHRVSGSYGGEINDTRFNLTVSEFGTRGFSVLRPSASPTADPDRDGYRNTGVAASLTQSFGPGTRAGFTGFLVDGRLDFDDAFAVSASDKQTAATRVGLLSAFVEHRPGDTWTTRLTLSRGTDRFADRLNGVPNSSFETTTDQASWQNNLSLAPGQQVIAGIEARQQKVSSTTDYTRTARSVTGAFAGYTGRFGDHDLQGNVRNERYSDFGSASTYLAGYGYRITEAWRLSAAASSAFRAPNYNELYYPFFGNPALQPERARSTELGARYATGAHLVRLAVFRTRIHDLIGGFPVANINQAEITGAELSYRGEILGADVNASITAQNPVDRGSNDQLLRRARQFAALTVQKSIGAWRLGGDVRGSGARDDNNITAFPPVRETLGGYSVVNLTARYQATRELAVQARAENVFNRDYQLIHGYNMQPRGFFLSLSYQP